mmetsp:Transcript_5588/g.18147  ORF Transcript_5588/g.18147 Transcript_5588/m.18147 type:complete len:324 (+) Transcript_5588:1388-2359(+)
MPRLSELAALSTAAARRRITLAELPEPLIEPRDTLTASRDTSMMRPRRVASSATDSCTTNSPSGSPAPRAASAAAFGFNDSSEMDGVRDRAPPTTARAASARGSTPPPGSLGSSVGTATRQAGADRDLRRRPPGPPAVGWGRRKRELRPSSSLATPGPPAGATRLVTFILILEPPLGVDTTMSDVDESLPRGVPLRRARAEAGAEADGASVVASARRGAPLVTAALSDTLPGDRSAATVCCSNTVSCEYLSHSRACTPVSCPSTGWSLTHRAMRSHSVATFANDRPSLARCSNGSRMMLRQSGKPPSGGGRVRPGTTSTYTSV